jgi:DNA-binding NarL/FixJ family response regulator
MGVQGYDDHERLLVSSLRAPPAINAPTLGRGETIDSQLDSEGIEHVPLGSGAVSVSLSERRALRSHAHVAEAAEKRVIVIESRVFLRECIQRSLESALSMPVETLSSFSEFDEQRSSGPIRLVIISLGDGNSQERANAFSVLSELTPAVPAVILSSKLDFETMRAAMACGAKGYIPMTMGFQIAIEAVRFVLAGGTYVPAECLLSGIPPASPSSQRPQTAGAITARELAVIRAIQQGKPNKIIAYELNMCESTVKVHVRHVMKKLRAKNRTDVAIRATDLLSCPRCMGQSECWSAGRCLKRIA